VLEFGASYCSFSLSPLRANDALACFDNYSPKQLLYLPMRTPFPDADSLLNSLLFKTKASAMSTEALDLKEQSPLILIRAFTS
jgi:hypothetical protein